MKKKPEYVEGRQAFENFDNVAFVEPAGIVEPKFAVDFDAPAGDDFSHLRPALARQPAAH